MATSPPIQDMPPKGGYSKIIFERVPAKKVFSGAKVIGAYLVLQFGALYYRTKYLNPARKRIEVEHRGSHLAVLPFLLAERDRARMKSLIENRAAEAELMKDVEGWVPGTLAGEPIYKTLPPDTWVEPYNMEYYAHNNRKDAEENDWLYYMF